jgi:spore coat-associated protein N
MKKRLAVSFMTMALVAGLVGGSTFAYFSSTDANAENTFTAGTVAISAGDYAQTTSALTITNLAPGDVYHGSFVVDNTSSLESSVAVSPVTTGSLFSAGNATVSLDNVLPATLAAGEDLTVPFTVTYDSAATVQGLTGTLAFSVTAEQTANR